MSDKNTEQQLFYSLGLALYLVHNGGDVSDDGDANMFRKHIESGEYPFDPSFRHEKEKLIAFWIGKHREELNDLIRHFYHFREMNPNNKK